MVAFRDGDGLRSQFMAHREVWSNRISLRYGFQTVGDGWTAMQPGVMAKQDRNQVVPAFLEVENDEAQQLMDTLWECGLRPTEGSGSAGSLAATQRHLEDMRTLVFKENK